MLLKTAAKVRLFSGRNDKTSILLAAIHPFGHTCTVQTKQRRGTPCAPLPSVFILFPCSCLLALYWHVSILRHKAYKLPEVAAIVVVRFDFVTGEAEIVRVVALAVRR